MACAIGTKFFDQNDREFVPTGGTLKNICRIDNSKTRELLRGIEFTTMCDVTNPLCGKNGAAYIYGPQKGADPKMVEELDRGLLNFAEALKESLGADVALIPGAGAAGGMGAGTVAFLDSKLKSGIDMMLDAVDFDRMAKGTDLIFTGEGRIDAQSMMGKVLSGVSKRAAGHNIPVIALTGGVEGEIGGVYDMGIRAVFSINKKPMELERAKREAAQNLAFTCDNILRMLRSFDCNNV